MGRGLSTINAPNTGDWGAYWTIYHDIYLNADAQSLAVCANSAGFTIDLIKLTKMN